MNIYSSSNNSLIGLVFDAFGNEIFSKKENVGAIHAIIKGRFIHKDTADTLCKVVNFNRILSVI